MNQPRAWFASVAGAFPRESASQDRLGAIALQASGELAGREAIVRRFYEGSGVLTRGVCALEGDQARAFFPPAGAPTPSTPRRLEAWLAHASDLGVRASTAALSKANIPPDRVTHIVTASCTGFASPGIDQAIIESLGLRRSVERVHVAFMGCHAAINALRVARALARADPHAVVLVVASEVCSVHFQHQGLSTGQIIANAIFADGAGACVVVGEEARSEMDIRATLHLAASTSVLIPSTRDAMTWTCGEQGFVMGLSKDVPAIIQRDVRAWIEPWLASHQSTIASIRAWCVHPGGPRVLESVEHALALDANALAVSRDVLREHGNMSSPTVLAILERILQRDPCPGPGVMMAFGPGLTAEACLLLPA